jgi:3-hydroxyisobutyrate dehydrogenase-like beta-hydroxyacid dehydrogenase
MLQALQKAGLNASGYDVRAGIHESVSTDPAVLGEADILITVVRDEAQTNSLLTQLLAQRHQLKYCLLSSTLRPSYVLELRERLPASIVCVDAPMSGAPIAAQECRLSFMLGGEPAHLQHLMPLFQAMGQAIFQLGGLSMGMRAKVLNNMVAASTVAAVRRAYGYAERMGLEQDQLRALMEKSSGSTWFGNHFDSISWAGESYSPDNTMGILIKDVQSLIDEVQASQAVDFEQAVQAAIKKL